VAVLNAVLGDRLDEQESSLALPMTLRNAGKDVPVDRAGLETAFPAATGRLALFVHGLAETDLGWLGRDGQGRPWSYAHALEQNGWTGAAVRYNTGRHISASGASLACLLDAVVAVWPVPVHDLALVGHSMGGLVIRAACTPAAQVDHSWSELVRSCVYLGAPHDGAALEQGVNVLGRVLSGVAEAGPLATVLRLRSAGIQDMRYGVFTADSEEDDVDGVVSGADAEVAFLPTARHHLVAAHVGPSAKDPLARAVGDWMVRPGSALGLERRGGRVDPAERTTLPGANHFDLLKDPRLADKLLEWLP